MIIIIIEFTFYNDSIIEDDIVRWHTINIFTKAEHYYDKDFCRSQKINFLDEKKFYVYKEKIFLSIHQKNIF